MNENNSKAIIDLLEPVSEIFKSSFSIQYLIGLAHSRLKQYDEAINYYAKSHLIEPNSSSLLHSMAILYDAKENWNKSDSIYVHLIRIDSSDAQALNNYAYSLVERDQNLDEALMMAKKAIALEPNNASYLDTIGWIYYKLNKTKKAKQFLEYSLEIVEDNSVVLEHLGDVFMKDNKLKEAINYYKRALALDKDNPMLIEKASPE
jgi:tetratricopeptide (TPR) repeat protein